ncbi:S53 family peptidase [Lactobacillaceae bacterium Melli_B4]
MIGIKAARWNQSSKQKKMVKIGTLCLSLLVGVALFSGFTPHRIAAKSTKVVTTVKANQKQTVNLVLKPRSEQQLSTYINQSVTPGNVNYRNYLTPQEFADTYGRSEGDVHRIQRYFKKYHLKTSVYSGRLVVKITGQTKNVEKAFKVKLKHVKVTDNSYQKTNHAVKLPANIKSQVLGIFGLNDNTYTNPGKQLSSHITQSQSDTNAYQSAPQKFMETYNVSTLYKNNYVGKGQTIGIISFANFNPNDAVKFWQSEGIPAKKNRIKTYQVGKTTNNGEDETAMDVEQAGAVAPKADINVYTSKPSASGMVNSMATALAQNKVSSLSISWGQSENQVKTQIKNGLLPKNYNRIINLLFQQAAIQGISVFASTGDNGAYDGMGENRYYKLTVDTPANSPYVTAVGGTSLPRIYTVNGKKVTIENERAWSNDFLYPKFDNQTSLNPTKNPTKWIASYFAGGGGGFSSLNAVPDYQVGVSGVGTFKANQIWESKKGYLNRFNQARVLTGTYSGRNVPDISANADPNTGYSSYHDGKWYITGGTSVVTPQMAGMSAVINSAQNVRTGFWNPQIYRFAQAKNSPFTPLNSDTNNNNLYYTGQPGKLYNQATGLGTVDFGKLNDAFSGQK